MSQPNDEDLSQWQGRSTVELDLSGVSEMSNDPLPAGTYRCRVVKFDPNQVSKKDLQKISIWFMVIEPEQYAKRYIFDQYTIQPSVLPYLKATLRGIFGVASIGNLNLEWAAENAIDREVTVRITIRKTEDYGESNQVQAVGALGMPLEIPGSTPTAAGAAGRQHTGAAPARATTQQGTPSFFKH
jgi:hypothetical protein